MKSLIIIWLWLILLMLATPAQNNQTTEPAQPVPPAPLTCPNAQLFEKIRELWVNKEPLQMLDYMESRVRIGVRISTSSRTVSNVYAATQAAGILKKHLNEIRIIEFRYLPDKMSEKQGVALYRYQYLANGQEKHSLIYINLIAKTTGLGVTKWLISSILEVDF